jgi:SAM-dependent methyltransferase
MMILLKNSTKLLLAVNILFFVNDLKSNTVEHKDFQLDLYLDYIRYNTQEKVGILPYILQKPEGTYLEIGTGGDPIALMLEKIPANARTILIASDVDDHILKALPVRHPALNKYIESKQGPSLRLQQLNAVDMHIFENNSLDGINASSVLHEIVSYAGGFNGMNKFFQESFRALKPGGILVYRDPECVSDKKTPVTVSLKNKSVRLFAHIFCISF